MLIHGIELLYIVKGQWAPDHACFFANVPIGSLGEDLENTINVISIE